MEVDLPVSDNCGAEPENTVSVSEDTQNPDPVSAEASSENPPVVEQPILEKLLKSPSPTQEEASAVPIAAKPRKPAP